MVKTIKVVEQILERFFLPIPDIEFTSKQNLKLRSLQTKLKPMFVPQRIYSVRY